MSQLNNHKLEMETNPINIIIKEEEPFYNQLIKVFTWEQRRISLICQEYCQNVSKDPVIASSMKEYENKIMMYQRMINQINRQLKRQKAMEKSQSNSTN